MEGEGSSCGEYCCMQLYGVFAVTAKVKDEEVEQQRRIEEAARKIELLMTQPSNTSVC